MNKLLKIICLCFLTSICSLSSFSQKNDAPKFNQYKVNADFSGKPRQVRRVPEIKVENYEQRIIDESKRPPNFAGHYRIAVYGCGSDCLGFAIINSKTGKVYIPNEFDAVFRVPFQQDEHLQFRVNSKLLIISGRLLPWEKNNGKAYKFYYRWIGTRLILIKKKKLILPND